MFQPLLRSALDQVEGSLACVLMGLDGIAVDSASTGSLPGQHDARALATEYAEHVRRLKTTLAYTGQGALAETRIASEQFQVVALLLNQDYFLLLLMGTDAFAGKGSFVLRSLAPAVTQQL